MKKSLVLVAFMALPGLMMSQKKGFDYKFYGQVRTDLFYNSRANSETVDGLFYMYPKDISNDADGKDLNSFANGGFFLQNWKWISAVRELHFQCSVCDMYISIWTGASLPCL